MTLCPRPVRRHGIGMGHVSVEQPIPIPAARTSQIKRSWGHPSGSQNRLENGGLGGARSTSRPPSRLVGAVDQRQPASLSGEVVGPVAPEEDSASAAISRRQPPTRTSWPCRQGLRQAAYILWFSPSNSSSERWLSARCVRHSTVPRLGAERQDMSSTLGRAAVATPYWHSISPLPTKRIKSSTRGSFAARRSGQPLGRIS